MEVTSTPTTAIKTPETKDEKPPPQTQSPKPLSFTNGVLKRHKHQHYETSPVVVVSYKECLKNHAASLGGHALDGCGEFMPSPSSTTTNPTSLKCAACGCHRNFHRREPEENTFIVEYHRHKLPPAPPTHSRSPNSPSPPPLSTPYYPSAPHMLLALSAGLPAAGDNYPAVNVNVATPMPATATATATMMMTGKTDGRKRFRTRFSHEQKEKMYSFSEKLGWKMQKKDEKLVEEFCEELGIGKGILKVWMHNNKHTFGKRDVNGIKNSLDETKTNNHNHSYDYQNNNSSGHGPVAINGSSSSS